MPSRQRYVVIGVVSLALLLGVVLAHVLQWIWLSAGLNDPYFFSLREISLTSLLATVLAGGAATFCLKHAATKQIASEIVDELAKVSWPSREETGYATVVVVVTVLICSAYLGIFDTFWLWVTNWILGVKVATPG